MDEAFAYLDEWSEHAAGIERNFARSLIGSKEGAITQARSRTATLAGMIKIAAAGFQESANQRTATLDVICKAIADESLVTAMNLTSMTPSEEVKDMVRRHVTFSMNRLVTDAAHRIELHQLNMKRIALLARSMRDDNKWDASAALLRARESVGSRSSVSVDRTGRKQHTERYTKLTVRGLGVSCLTDSIVMISGAALFDVKTFSGDFVERLAVEDYESARVRLFHPQSERYLVPSSK